MTRALIVALALAVASTGLTANPIGLPQRRQACRELCLQLLHRRAECFTPTGRIRATCHFRRTVRRCVHGKESCVLGITSSTTTTTLPSTSGAFRWPSPTPAEW
jgi:hypothetical protein